MDMSIGVKDTRASTLDEKRIADQDLIDEAERYCREHRYEASTREARELILKMRSRITALTTPNG